MPSLPPPSPSLPLPSPPSVIARRPRQGRRSHRKHWTTTVAVVAASAAILFIASLALTSARAQSTEVDTATAVDTSTSDTPTVTSATDDSTTSTSTAVSTSDTPSSTTSSDSTTSETSTTDSGGQSTTSTPTQDSSTTDTGSGSSTDESSVSSSASSLGNQANFVSSSSSASTSVKKSSTSDVAAGTVSLSPEASTTGSDSSSISSSSAASTSPAALAGIITGCVVAAAVLGAVALVVRRRQQTRKNGGLEDHEVTGFDDSGSKRDSAYGRSGFRKFSSGSLGMTEMPRSASMNTGSLSRSSHASLDRSKAGSRGQMVMNSEVDPMSIVSSYSAGVYAAGSMVPAGNNASNKSPHLADSLMSPNAANPFAMSSFSSDYAAAMNSYMSLYGGAAPSPAPLSGNNLYTGAGVTRHDSVNSVSSTGSAGLKQDFYSSYEQGPLSSHDEFNQREVPNPMYANETPFDKHVEPGRPKQNYQSVMSFDSAYDHDDDGGVAESLARKKAQHQSIFTTFTGTPSEFGDDRADFISPVSPVSPASPFSPSKGKAAMRPRSPTSAPQSSFAPPAELDLPPPSVSNTVKGASPVKAGSTPPPPFSSAPTVSNVGEGRKTSVKEAAAANAKKSADMLRSIDGEISALLDAAAASAASAAKQPPPPSASQKAPQPQQPTPRQPAAPAAPAAPPAFISRRMSSLGVHSTALAPAGTNETSANPVPASMKVRAPITGPSPLRRTSTAATATPVRPVSRRIVVAAVAPPPARQPVVVAAAPRAVAVPPAAAVAASTTAAAPPAAAAAVNADDDDEEEVVVDGDADTDSDDEAPARGGVLPDPDRWRSRDSVGSIDVVDADLDDDADTDDEN